MTDYRIDKKLILFIALMLFVFFFTPNVFAALDEDIPLPADAVMTFENPMKFGPTTSMIRNYITSLNQNQIEQFYRKELPKKGWRENMPKAIVFTKADRIVTVVVSALKKSSKDKKTYFTIISSTAPPEGMVKAMQKDKPDPLSFMPLYPGAKQMLLMDTDKGVMAGYQTEDDVNDVVFFYKSKMLAYGWGLFEETPVKERKFDDCPECQKKVPNMPEGMPRIKGNLYTAHLRFKRGESEICSISIDTYDIGNIKVAPELQDAGFSPAAISGKTRITVSYSDRKKNAK